MEAVMNGEQIRLASIIFGEIVWYSSLTQKEERLTHELLERVAWSK
jgi:hypothetical protein